MSLRDFLLGLGVTVFSVGVSWGVFSERITSIEARTSEIEIRLDRKDDQFMALQTEIAKISTNIEWIKERLAKGP
jgi:uncharacterized coiled-coil protein SlyX